MGKRTTVTQKSLVDRKIITATQARTITNLITAIQGLRKTVIPISTIPKRTNIVSTFGGMIIEYGDTYECINVASSVHTAVVVPTDIDLPIQIRFFVVFEGSWTDYLEKYPKHYHRLLAALSWTAGALGAFRYKEKIG